MIKKAVIPAAGYGTKFLPATKSVPQEMFPIIDTPTLQLIVEEALGAGIDEILIITSSSKSIIMDYFDKNLELEKYLRKNNKPIELKVVEYVANLANIHYVCQKEQNGLAQAILHAETFVKDEPFAVLLPNELFKGNEPAIKELIEVFEKYEGTVLGTFEVAPGQTKEFNICDPLKAMDNKVFKLKTLVEKPEPNVAPSLSAISGRFILTPQIFELLKSEKPNDHGEIKLISSLIKLFETESVYSSDLKAKRYDVGNPLGYLEAIIDFALDSDDLKEEFKELLIKKTKQTSENKK